MALLAAACADDGEDSAASGTAVSATATTSSSTTGEGPDVPPDSTDSEAGAELDSGSGTAGGSGSGSETSADTDNGDSGLLLVYDREDNRYQQSVVLPHASYVYFPAGQLAPGQSAFLFFMAAETPGLCDDLEAGIGRPDAYFALLDIQQPDLERDGSFTPRGYGPDSGHSTFLADGSCEGVAASSQAGLEILSSTTTEIELSVPGLDGPPTNLSGSVTATECTLTTIPLTADLQGC